jgi:hypothetical protein
MPHWLIVYDRSQGELLRCCEFSDSQEALRERFAVERDNREKSWLEIVVLGGNSLETIKSTHSRYFATATSGGH